MPIDPSVTPACVNPWRLELLIRFRGSRSLRIVAFQITDIHKNKYLDRSEGATEEEWAVRLLGRDMVRLPVQDDRDRRRAGFFHVYQEALAVGRDRILVSWKSMQCVQARVEQRHGDARFQSMTV